MGFGGIGFQDCVRDFFQKRVRPLRDGHPIYFRKLFRHRRIESNVCK